MARLPRLSRLPRLAALVVALVTLISCAAGTTLGPGLRAAAADEPVALSSAATGAPSIALTSVSPAVLTRTDTLTVTGVVTAGSTALSTPTIRLVRGVDTVTSRDDVTTWAASTDRAGGRTVATQTLPSLAAGARTGFTLTVPSHGLSSSAAFAVLPVALELADASGSAVGSPLHTFVGWYARKEYEPLSVAVVAPVTLPADPDLLSVAESTRLGAWRSQLASSGHLTRLLGGLDVPGLDVTLAVDPAVLGRPTTAAAGSGGSSSTSAPTTSSSPSSSPSTSPGSGSTTGTTGTTDDVVDPVSSLVAPFARHLASAATATGTTTVRHSLWSLPYGDPDVAALADLAASAGGSSSADPGVAAQVAAGAGLGDRIAALAGTSRVPVTSGVAWPVDGGLTTAREQALRSLYGSGPQATLVSGSTLPTASAGFSATAPHTSPGGTPLLGWDDTMSALTLRTTSVSAGALATQELVAQTATYLGQSPGVARSVLIAVPRTVDPNPGALRSLLATLTRIPWVTPTSADTLLSAATASDRVDSLGASAASVPAPVVTSTLLSTVKSTDATLDTIASVFSGTRTESLAWQDALAQTDSVRWRSRPAAVPALLAGARAWAGQVTSGIRVLSQDTNFLADEGILQVTIVNDLQSPVSGLRLVLGPTNPRLRVVSQPDPVTISARSRATVNVRVRAVAAGLVPVSASLTTSNGTPIGSPAQLTVRANPPGRALYLVGGGLVAAVLLAGIVRSLLRRRNTRPGPPDTPPETARETAHDTPHDTRATA